jgi:hypothetical protein
MKVKITIPESLEDITLGQYQEFQTVLEHNENDANDDLVRKKMVQIFCKVPLSVVDRMKQVDFLEAVRRVTEVLNEKTKLVNVVDLHGVKLGFIPKLDDITAGEFADLSNYLGDVKNLHKAMAVLYRPIKGKVDRLGKYLIQDYKSALTYSEAMKQLPMNIVQGSMLFFWTLKIELLQATLKYLKEEEITNTNGLEKNGDGINHFTQLLEEITLKLKTLQERSYTAYSTF